MGNKVDDIGAAGRLGAVKRLALRGVAFTAAGAMCLAISARALLVVQDTNTGVVMGLAGILALIPGARSLRRAYGTVTLHLAERRAVKQLRTRLREDWALQVAYVQGALVARLTPPAGPSWIVVVRCLARPRAKRRQWAWRAARLTVDGDSLNAALALTREIGTAYGAHPVLWYPGEHGAAHAPGDQVALVSGSAAQVLQVCGACRDGWVKRLLQSLVGRAASEKESP